MVVPLWGSVSKTKDSWKSSLVPTWSQFSLAQLETSPEPPDSV